MNSRLKKSWQGLWWISLVAVLVGVIGFLVTHDNGYLPALFVAGFSLGFITCRISCDTEIAAYEKMGE